jgi:hypothetical protein
MAKSENKDKGSEIKYTVVSSFRDINDFSLEYTEGVDVSEMDKTRLDILVEKGLVEKT